MKVEEVKDKIKVLIEKENIEKRIDELALKIQNDYLNKDILVICILKGSLFFTVDLTKRINNHKLEIDFMRISSYGDELISSGNINIIKDLESDINGRNVLIVEDIIDSGNTLYYLKDILEKRNPKSLKICTLLDKKSRRVKNIVPDYIGFEIENKFVVGYGLDYKDCFRNLPFIGYVDI